MSICAVLLPQILSQQFLSLHCYKVRGDHLQWILIYYLRRGDAIKLSSLPSNLRPHYLFTMADNDNKEEEDWVRNQFDNQIGNCCDIYCFDDFFTCPRDSELGTVLIDWRLYRCAINSSGILEFRHVSKNNDLCRKVRCVCQFQALPFIISPSSLCS